jgi:exonuclease VII small subunit
MANNDTDTEYYVYLLYYAKLIQNIKQKIDEFYKIAPGNTEGIEEKNKLYTELKDYIKTFKKWLNAFLVNSKFDGLSINEEFNIFQNLLNDLRVTVTDDDALRERYIAKALTIWQEGHPGISHQSQAEWEAKLLSINTKFDEILKDKINLFWSQHQKILNMYNELSKNFKYQDLKGQIETLKMGKTTELEQHVSELEQPVSELEQPVSELEKTEALIKYYKEELEKTEALIKYYKEELEKTEALIKYYKVELEQKLIDSQTAYRELVSKKAQAKAKKTPRFMPKEAQEAIKKAQEEVENIKQAILILKSGIKTLLNKKNKIKKLKNEIETLVGLEAEAEAEAGTEKNVIDIILSLENITEFVLYNFFKNIKHLQNDYFSELIEIILKLRGKPEPDSSFLSWLPFPATEKPLSFYQAKLKTLLSTYKETQEEIDLLKINIETELRRRAFAVEHYFELNIIDAKRKKLDELEEYYDIIKQQIDGVIKSFGTKKNTFLRERETEELNKLLKLLKNYNLNKYIWWLLLKSIDSSNKEPEPEQEVFEPMIESKSLFSSSKTKKPMFNDFFQKKLQDFFTKREDLAKQPFEEIKKDIEDKLRERIRNNVITEIRIGIRSIDFIQSEHFVLSYEELKEMEKRVYKEVYTEVYPEVQEDLTVPAGGSRKKSRNTKNKRQINRKSRNTKNKRQMNSKSNKAQKKSKKRRN